MKEIKFLRCIVVCVALFAVSATISALVGKMIITDTVYYAVSSDNSPVGVTEFIGDVRVVSEGTLFQLLFMLLSGFSMIPIVSASFVCIVRGVTLGYCASTITSGITEAGAIVPIGTCYALSTVTVILFSALSVSFSESIRKDGMSASSSAKYLAVFLVFSGCAVFCDGARLFFV